VSGKSGRLHHKSNCRLSLIKSPSATVRMSVCSLAAGQRKLNISLSTNCTLSSFHRAEPMSGENCSRPAPVSDSSFRFVVVVTPTHPTLPYPDQESSPPLRRFFTTSGVRSTSDRTLKTDVRHPRNAVKSPRLIGLERSLGCSPRRPTVCLPETK